VHAISSKCPHLGGPLDLGDIEDVERSGLCVVCPWHRWTFSLRNGAIVIGDSGSGNFAALPVYPVAMDREGRISVGFTRFSSALFARPLDF
jgi:nitrite reductase/ring-hydroxylating ferredoxin subunit